MLSRDQGAGFMRNCLPILSICCYGNQQTGQAKVIDSEINEGSSNDLDNIEILKVPVRVCMFMY